MKKAERLSSGGSGITPDPSSNPHVFTTQSMFCAAYLIYRGHAPQQFRMLAAPKGEFVFELTPDLQFDIAGYFGGEVQVVLKDYMRTYHSVRDRVMNCRRGLQSNPQPEAGKR